VHYSMGGLWVDYRQMTNLPGLFAAGECEYQYHGANRLGANALVACVFGGIVGGPASYEWAAANSKNDPSAAPFDRAVSELKQRAARTAARSGSESLFEIRREMAQWMIRNVTIVRDNAELAKTQEKLIELQRRQQSAPLPDASPWSNQSLVLALELENMLDLARAITAGALKRDESRGAHFKPAFPKRDDANWMRTTKARWTAAGPELDFSETIDTSLLKPVERRYDVMPANAPKPGGVATPAAAH